MTDNDTPQTIQAEEWPTDRGPLYTLAALGMIREGTRALTWAVAPSIQTDNYGRTIYRAVCSYMSHNAIRELAALSLEGWQVRVGPTNGRLKITITTPTN